MTERIFAKHLHDRRNRRVVDSALPTATSFLQPSEPVSGILVGDDLWVPPGQSTASRLPPARSRGFCRGSRVSQQDNRALVYESALERDFACILEADRHFIHVQDQPPAVTYRTPDGQPHRHTFDFLATTTDGQRIAYAVKPTAYVERSGIEDVLALIAEQVSTSFADSFLLRTESHVTRDRAYDARLILRSRRGRSAPDVAHLLGIVRTLRGATEVSELAAASKLGGRALTAIVCLIDEGVLNRVSKGRIDDHTLVRFQAHREA